MKRISAPALKLRPAGMPQWRIFALAMLCLLFVPASLQAAPLLGTPLVIPTPKHLLLSGSVFRISPQTRLVIADNATVADKAAALSVRQVLHEQFGLPPLPIVRERRVHGSGHDLLLFGETKRVRRLAKALTRRGASVPLHSEGYCLRVGADQVLVAGRDVRGTFYGAQTLCQLFRRDTHGIYIAPAQVDDYPTLAWRGAHLFVGDHALPFHEKLIDRIFARLKFNTLVLECEQARWQTLGKSAPPWAMSKADLRREIRYAWHHHLNVIPLVQSVGHMSWALTDHPNWAEDPQTPYAADVTNPATQAFLFRLYDEVLDTFHSDALHIGGDEVALRGRYPYQSAGRYPTLAAAYVVQVKRLHDYLARRGVRTLMWGDMLLAHGEAPDACNAPTYSDAAWMRAHLPHDILITDWHYAPTGPFPSPALFQASGFPSTIGASWYKLDNIAAFSRALASTGQRGLLQTTWAGYDSSEANLTHERRQFTAFVVAAEEAWNGGAVDPNRLPYDPAVVFAACMTAGDGITPDVAKLGKIPWNVSMP